MIAEALTWLALAIPAAEAPNPDTACKGKCWQKFLYRKARKATPREPIPHYIVECESEGGLHVPAGDGRGGGRYQIIPSTWRVSLPSRRFIGIAGGNKGPRWSSRLLQDKVAHIIYQRDGAQAWSCA